MFPFGLEAMPPEHGTGRPAKEPLLLIHGIDDQVVPITQSEEFAAKFRRVHLWEVLGGHHAERSQPEVLQRALVWLAEVAEAQVQGTIRP